MKTNTILRAFLVVPFALTALACGSPQRPVTFTTSANAENGIDAVSRTLSAEGHATTGVDRRAGVVHTEWKDTGFLYGQVQNAPASIVRRFTVVLTPSGEGSAVTVRMDAKRCAQGNFSISGGEVSGSCEEMTVLPDQFQGEVDDLGAKVRRSLSQAPAAAR